MPKQDYVVDAEIDGLNKGSWLAGCLRGIIIGLLVFGGGIVALSLSQPLPEHLPGVGAVKIVGGPGGASSSDAEGSAEDPAATAAVQGQGTDAGAGSRPVASVPVAGSDDASRVAVAAAAARPETSVAGGAARPDDGVEAARAVPGAADLTGVPSAATGSVAGSAEDASVGSGEDAEATETGTETGTGTETETETETGKTDTQSADAQSADAASDDSRNTTASNGEAPGDDTSSAETTVIAALPAPTEGDAGAEPAARPAEALPKISLPGKALDVNARRFDAPEGASLMAVVLTKPGDGAISGELLPILTMPLTLSIAPGSIESRVLAERARAAGHEVLAELSGMPVSGASDEVTDRATALLADLDLSVGATASDGAALLKDLDAMRAVMAPLSQHGFAWVDPRPSITPASRLAANGTGTPWTVGDRLIPAEATSDQVYQNLEAASFQASRQGTVIVFATATGPTLQALLRWGLERGGQEVWFAPVSAVIARRQLN